MSRESLVFSQESGNVREQMKKIIAPAYLFCILFAKSPVRNKAITPDFCSSKNFISFHKTIYYEKADHRLIGIYDAGKQL
jgi:hypothetical protein